MMYPYTPRPLWDLLWSLLASFVVVPAVLVLMLLHGGT